LDIQPEPDPDADADSALLSEAIPRPWGGHGPRAAVVDLGSNSVRLVVFEGRGRNPLPIFNEKAVLRLGKGLEETGRLNEEGVERALTVMNRYFAIGRAMRADPFEVLATAAVRDAANGAAFVAALESRMPGVPIRVLSGEQEANFSASGVLCGIPAAEGVLADIGGGSLELVRLTPRGGNEAGRSDAVTLPLGVIRLAERAGGDPVRARAIAEADLAEVKWLPAGAGRDLYLVGGAWRALARIHIAQTGYPLAMVHHYTIGRDEARDLTGVIAAAPRRTLEKMQGVPRRRVDDLCYAAVVLRRVLRATGARRVVFSANGLREGWYLQLVPASVRAEDPLLAAAHDYASRLARDQSLPPGLLAWTDPLFPMESGEERRLREAACWMSDIGSRDHPEYRAEQAYFRALRQPGSGLDHHARAFLALALAVRYEAEPEAPFLVTARLLLSAEAARRATILGVALRLAYTLSAGTPHLLSGTRLTVEHRLTLRLAEGSGVFAGESVTRRLDRLALALGLEATTEVAR
jgi:exopolyphosphatase/guanosine-5'-triphosphate,3'-diphosphate pyrophosphatase